MTIGWDRPLVSETLRRHRLPSSPTDATPATEQPLPRDFRALYRRGVANQHFSSSRAGSGGCNGRSRPPRCRQGVGPHGPGDPRVRRMGQAPRHPRPSGRGLSRQPPSSAACSAGLKTLDRVMKCRSSPAASENPSGSPSPTSKISWVCSQTWNCRKSM
jgi:hypothetical protein